MFTGSLELFDAIRSAPMPVIAAVNGPAFGGGNELVVCCDLAIAAESAELGQTGVKVGSAPVLGGTNVLALTAGEKKAKRSPSSVAGTPLARRSSSDGSTRWCPTTSSRTRSSDGATS